MELTKTFDEKINYIEEIQKLKLNVVLMEMHFVSIWILQMFIKMIVK